jgi:pfkB family carbohydrate kinase
MIVVFGSINLDLVTRVETIPGPGETTLGGDYATSPGGKGANQALAARRAGAKVVMVGAIGKDSFAAEAIALLKADGVDLSATREVAAPTGAAFIAVDAHGENAIVVASGANRLAVAKQLETLTGPYRTAQPEIARRGRYSRRQRTRGADARRSVKTSDAGARGGRSLCRPNAGYRLHRHVRACRCGRLRQGRAFRCASAKSRSGRHHRRRRYIRWGFCGGPRWRALVRDSDETRPRRRQSGLRQARRAAKHALCGGDRSSRQASAVGR